MNLKQKLYNLFEKPYLEKYGYIFQLYLIFVIFLNILSFTLPIILPFSDEIRDIFKTIEDATIFSFAVELILRYYSIGLDKRYAGISGKVKYTFTIYTIIDIAVLLPYILFETNLSYLRFFRIIRVFRLFRFKKTIKKYFTIVYFSKLNIISQILVLLILSIFFILLFSIIFHSIKTSALIFIDPPSIAETNGYFEVFVGITELILGLLVGGALISIITEFLDNSIDNIKKGYFPYKGKNHIVIINYNQKLEIILDEINLYYRGMQTDQDIVLFLSNTDIEKFSNSMSSYSNLNLFLITGDLYHFNSYERLSLSFASKIIVLKDKNINNKKLLKYVISHIKFKIKVEFVVEVSNNKYNNEIYKEIFEKYHFTMIHSDTVMKTVIKRSIVDYKHFRLLKEIFSFEGYEFYIKDTKEFFDYKLTFEEAFNSFKKGILVGVVKNNHMHLNPKFNTKIETSDRLILLLGKPDDYEIKKEEKLIAYDDIILQQPPLKEFRKVAIVGDYSDISKDDLKEFLTDRAIEHLTIFTKNYYYDLKFWKKLDSEFELIVLNLEDEFEFNLMLYLKAIFKSQNIMNKIVNIINNPLEANLLNDKSKNIILSEELAAKYIVQNIFSHYISEIFYVLTHTVGSELYILSRKDYQKIFDYDFGQFKNILLKNEMIYIGAFVGEKFIFEYDKLEKIEYFVVIAEGI